MTIAAIITPRSSHLQNSQEYIVGLYDTSQPRQPNAEDPRARYAFVGMQGPFRRLEDAENVAHQFDRALPL
mgnify:CR=1 FL=1